MDWNNINKDRDTSGLGPIEYDQSKVPALIRKHADNVRTKTYGQEVREVQARNAELAGLIAQEAKNTSSSTETRQDLIETRYDVAIGALTEDSEVLDARVDAYGNPFNNLGNRINNIENDLASRAVNLLAYDNLKVAITDGVNLGYDYTAALEAALVDHDSVFIPPIDDLFIQNVSLKSGTTLYGVPNMTVIKGVFKNDVGNYTETIFNIDSIEGVLIKNIEFDGNMTYTGYVGTSDRTKVKNLLHINHAKDIVFDNCKYTNFVSNYLNVSERVGWEGYLWAIMAIKYSENVYLFNNKLENTRLEGILAYATKNFVVDRLKSENTYMSTPIHAWYCDGVEIVDSNIIEDIGRTETEVGSTLNIYSKNVNITNNYIYGGSSIDFGNEANNPDFPDYVADNIKFHNNTIYGCINAVGNDNQLARNVDISGNYIDATGYARGINTGNTEHIKIHDNTLIGADEFIRFSGNYLKDIRIYDNHAFEIDRFISIRLSGKDVTDVEVFDNKVEGVRTAIGYNSFEGYHAFFYLDAPSATNLEKIENIRIKGNKVRTNGSWVYFKLSNYTNVIKGVEILENDFDGTNDEVNADNRAIEMNGLFKDPIVLENTFKNISEKGLKFRLINGIRFHRNKFYLSTSTTIPQVLDFFDTCTGILIAYDNEIFGDISKITYFMALNYGSSVEETLTRSNYPALYGRDFKNSESNSTGNRPTSRLSIGQSFFDTSLAKTIWWNGSAWKDANGTTV